MYVLKFEKRKKNEQNVKLKSSKEFKRVAFTISMSSLKYRRILDIKTHMEFGCQFKFHPHSGCFLQVAKKGSGSIRRQKCNVKIHSMLVISCAMVKKKKLGRENRMQFRGLESLVYLPRPYLLFHQALPIVLGLCGQGGSRVEMPLNYTNSIEFALFYK